MIINIMSGSRSQDGYATAAWRPALAALVLLASPLGLGAVGDEQVREFESQKYHFKVDYPVSWYPMAGTSDILDITNFERTAQVPGIALKIGGAEIAVTKARPEVQSVDQWVLADLPDDSELPKDFAADERDLPVENPAAGGCQRIKRTAWRHQIGPEVYFVETNYYCSTSAALYKVALTNWDGDPAQSKLRVIALEIARSLRTR